MRVFLIAILVSILSAFMSCRSESTLTTDTPVTREIALLHLDIPFPNSANSIYYLIHAGGLQDLEKFVRFDLDAAETESAIKAITESNNKMMARSLGYSPKSLESADIPWPRPEFLPMKWWDPNMIKRGTYRGHIDGYALRILVDENRSRIYIHQND